MPAALAKCAEPPEKLTVPLTRFTLAWIVPPPACRLIAGATRLPFFRDRSELAPRPVSPMLIDPLCALMMPDVLLMLIFWDDSAGSLPPANALAAGVDVDGSAISTSPAVDETTP